jgi:hypothetical protein
VPSTPLLCSSLAVAVAVAVLATPAEAAVALTKARARSAAVDAARDTCVATPWCRRWAVEPARACARRSPRRVDCTIRFRAADDWSSGLVLVTRTRRGGLEVGVAVPIQPV